MAKSYKYTKLACYVNNLSISVVGTISAILFIPFRDLYNFSYTELGFLVLINFCTQLIIDLVFSFFSDRFNIPATVKTMPVITFIGLLIYSLMPYIFTENAYFWLCIGTIIFSVSAGLNEVLASPVIAAIPSDNPEKEMSKLHSVYAWGVVVVVIISTLLLRFLGNENWHWLVIIWSVIPLFAAGFFSKAIIPDTSTNSEHGSTKSNQGLALLLCVICIFTGGAAECTMTQWISAFSERALGIPKIIGDVVGMALFALFLGIGRTLYSKFGKNIMKAMTYGMLSAFLCYLGASFSSNSYIGLIFCIAVGFSTSMLWPGTIILVGEKLPAVGVTAYAMLAAGGDLGASVVPQLVGIISDKVVETHFAVSYSEIIGLSAEQIGIKSAIFIAGMFPLAGFLLLLFMNKYFKKNNM